MKVPAANGVTPEAVHEFMQSVWPANQMDVRCVEISGRHVVAESSVDERQIRPGGFISGPTQFGMADLVLWWACFGAIGFEAMALTSELSIRFVRPAIGSALKARADLDSVGSKTIVGTIRVWTDDPDRPTAICQGTYAIPI